MPLLSGSLGFERFDIADASLKQFEESHLETLQQYSLENIPRLAGSEFHYGFMGGDHLFDHHFDFGKNIIGDAMHASVRVDTDTIPGAIRRAWLQIEQAALRAQNDSGRLTKAQKEEAKESVQQRVEDEVASGKYRRMANYPFLWDLPAGQLYIGASSNSAIGAVTDLMERAFSLELSRKSAGSIAIDWARDAGVLAEMSDLRPASFVDEVSFSDVPWANEYSDKPDFLGNEFFMWLWWQYVEVADTLTINQSQEVTFMFGKTLSLECPLGEHGKETISSESPVHLAEAVQAVQTGKLPRKAGLSLVCDGEQFDFVLQAETFGVSGAKIQSDDSDSLVGEGRVAAIRRLTETLEGLFLHFCERRVDEATWSHDLREMQAWLSSSREPVAI
jgi:hypothetical protein